MAAPVIIAELSRLEDPSTPATEKTNGYLELLNKISQNASAAESGPNLNAFLDSMLGPNGLGIVNSRPVLGHFVECIKTIPSVEQKLEICRHALDVLQSRGGQFAEQDASIRILAADLYESDDQHTAAARTLSGINLDSSQRITCDDDKIRIWIRIVRNYLEEDDTTSAETYLNKAKNLMHKCSDHELKLMFQLSQARILDARRKFLPASQAYHTLSFSPIIIEEERLKALSSAIICGVLAPAGPQRSRTLAHLFRDERASTLPSFPILSHMFLGRLVSPSEVADFSTSLSPHHQASLADGSTVLAKAVIEHNLLGASRLYDDIGFESLGRLLDLSAEEAEGYAARMIEQGRLSGRIDQIEGVVFFDREEGTGEMGTSAGQADRVVGGWLRRWDGNVKGVAEEVERVVGLMGGVYPEFVAAHLEH